MEEGDSLGDEFAENQRKIRDADHDDGHADDVRIAREQSLVGFEVPLQGIPQSGLPERAREDGDHGDADLDGREQA